ncbi:hypothetical protein RJD24_20065 [Bacillaceae bacterium IKA-2]|nr:hypothetical protein RJD24_20065 [Bacillaceae bacterium IKA-2]
MNIALHNITKENFAQYGEIIEVNQYSSEIFQVILPEDKVAEGWRKATLGSH